MERRCGGRNSHNIEEPGFECGIIMSTMAFE